MTRLQYFLGFLVLGFVAMSVQLALNARTLNEQGETILRNSKTVKELYDRSEDRWRKSDHDRWADELQRQNLILKVPK